MTFCCVCQCPENRLSGWRTLRTFPWCWWETSVTSRPGQSTPSRLRTYHAATAFPLLRPQPKPDRWEFSQRQPRPLHSKFCFSLCHCRWIPLQVCRACWMGPSKWTQWFFYYFHVEIKLFFTSCSPNNDFQAMIVQNLVHFITRRRVNLCAVVCQIQALTVLFVMMLLGKILGAVH